MPSVQQLNQCLAQLGELRPDFAQKRKRGIAPHKPLLLLAIIDMAQEGCLADRQVALSVGLAFRFGEYWRAVAERRGTKPDVRLPFFHLRTAGFWQPLDSEGRPAAARQLASTALLAEDFFACLLDANFRDQARRKLISRWFEQPAERVALYTMVGLPIPSADSQIADSKLGEMQDAKERGREGRFRNTVIPAYDFTCALTGYRVNTFRESIVDAAHIHQFGRGGANDPRNGIALCKNAHWLFDRGLWSLTDDYRVIVTQEDFLEAGPEAFLLRRMIGKVIGLPNQAHLRPDPKYLAWHRQHALGGSRGGHLTRGA
jgi:putative restriction endonuclease